MPPPAVEALVADTSMASPLVSVKQADIEGTSGQQCRYGRACKSALCCDSHPAGRDVDENPTSTICRFGRKCKRNGCFFLHPQGREVDEDPSKGVCRAGRACKRADCLYTHPGGRDMQGVETRQCHICGQSGHLMRECPRTRGGAVPVASGQHVSIADFPTEWRGSSVEKIVEHITAELEVFGTLSLFPVVIDHGKQAIAAFEDNELAKTAVEALHASVFSIELCDPPAPSQLGFPDFALLIKGFSERWVVSDVAALIHGTLKPSALLGIELLEPVAGQGSARVRCRDEGAARDAAKELHGQKVAGRPLSITVICGGNQETPSVASSTQFALPAPEDVERQDDKQKGGKDDENATSHPPMINGRVRTHVIHIDELDMPTRLQPEPAATGCEVFADPMPDAEEMDSCIAAFGEAEEIYHIPDPNIGRAGTRGYIRFRDHGAAKRCVAAGFAVWSESERTLSSQRTTKAKGEATVNTYSENIVARILGTSGNSLKKIQEDTGVVFLHLRGGDLGSGDHKQISSQRLHFVAEGDDASISRLREALAKHLAEIHSTVSDRLRGVSSRSQEPDKFRGREQEIVRTESSIVEAYNPTGGWKPPVGEALIGMSSGGGRARPDGAGAAPWQVLPGSTWQMPPSMNSDGSWIPPMSMVPPPPSCMPPGMPAGAIGMPPPTGWSFPGASPLPPSVPPSAPSASTPSSANPAGGPPSAPPSGMPPSAGQPLLWWPIAGGAAPHPPERTENRDKDRDKPGRGHDTLRERDRRRRDRSRSRSDSRQRRRRRR